LVACSLSLLGGFALEGGDGGKLALPTRKDRLLLAYLALSGGRPQSRERLAGLLWADRAEAQARDSLKQALAEIRQMFRQNGLDPVQADRGFVIFETKAIMVDAVEFMRLAADTQAADRAAALYRGNLLDGIDGVTTEFEEWLLPERERLGDLAVRVLEQLALSSTPNRVSDEAIRLGRCLLARDRIREPVYRALMGLHARQGERAEALKLYAACRDALKQDLGVAPDGKTEELYRDILTDRPSAPTSASEAEPTLACPSIAVLPFGNLSGDADLGHLCDGITEDIITELSRFRALFVIARHSSFAFKGKAVTVQQVGRELGVEYVLEGSVRRAGTRVRIIAQLVDTRTGAHIWAERVDREIGDLFVMQDEVTQHIVATIAHRVGKTEQARAARKRPEAMRAHDYVLRAWAIIAEETSEANQQSRALYEKALALEPTNMLALTGLAWTYVTEWESRWSNPADAALEHAYKLARQALFLDSTDYQTHLLFGYVQKRRKQFADALVHCEHVVAMNSNDADGIAHMGSLLVALGRFSEALDWYQKAVRLNPLHPAWYLWGIGEAHYGARQYEQAISPLRAAVNRFPTYVTPRRHLAATYAQMGRLDEARAEVAAIRKLDPSVCLAMYRERICYEKFADRDHYLDGLRKAGLPE
jgi:TolB-like protein